MNSFNVSELKENTYFTAEVVLDKTFLLLNNSIPVSKSLISALLDWDFKQVYSDGTIGSGASKMVFTPVSGGGSNIGLSGSADAAADKASAPRHKSKIAEIVQKSLEAANADMDTAEGDDRRFVVVQNVYNEYINYVTGLYTRFATHKELNLDEISSTISDLCVFVKDNKRFVLRIQPSVETVNKNFLISHSLRSTVLAITIGLQMRFPMSKLVELGVACVLHEIGMIRLPPQLYMTDRPLTPSEKNTIATHPVISYNILKSYSFPLSICMGVLEHHEKENGNGYPRKIDAAKISMYAKIISVACSFEAITAPRHYKDAQSSYDAMVEMLKNNGRQYDENVIKALLYSLSVYPIGAYVYLSSGKIAQVIDVNPENPKNPIVQIFNETEANGDPKTIQTNETTVKISRVLNNQEIHDFVEKTKQDKA